MDALWEIVLAGIHWLQAGLLNLLAPLHIFGPAIPVAVLAVATMVLARFLSRRFKTRRYRELKKEFQYWYHIKQEALQLKKEDPEKARQLGITIDKAKLNEVYYNFFFEGLLNNLLTLYIPFFSMLVFVNETYRPEALQAMFGRDYLFRMPWPGQNGHEVGAAFWYVACAFAAYLICAACAAFLRRPLQKQKPVRTEPSNAF